MKFIVEAVKSLCLERNVHILFVLQNSPLLYKKSRVNSKSLTIIQIVQNGTYLKILHQELTSGDTVFGSRSRLTARRFGSGPWSWSIHCSIVSSFRASGWTGFTEMSLTARNWPQLFKCSFSSRKKFQMKRLNRENSGGEMNTTS